MEPRRATLPWAVWGAGSAAVGAVAVASPLPHDAKVLLGVPWALFLAGPAALWLLVPRLHDDPRPWMRACAALLPGLSVAFALLTARGILRERPAFAALEAALVVGAALGAWHALRPAGPSTRRGALATGILALTVGLFAFDPVGFATVGVQAALAAGVVRLRRSAGEWARAALVGAGVLWAGALLVLALFGEARGTGVVTSPDGFAFLVGVAVAALVAALAALLLWRSPPPADAWA